MLRADASNWLIQIISEIGVCPFVSLFFWVRSLRCPPTTCLSTYPGATQHLSAADPDPHRGIPDCPQAVYQRVLRYPKHFALNSVDVLNETVAELPGSKNENTPVEEFLILSTFLGIH